MVDMAESIEGWADMRKPLALEAARIATGSADAEGYLVRADGRLVAVLVRLSDAQGELAGRWFL